jgi:hydroxymethylbilane synthase
MVRSALAKAHEVAEDQLEALLPIEVITTSGDRIQDQPLNAIGGKGLFTKEIEEAMTGNRIDIAVHSMKDMPTVLPEGLTIPCMLARNDPRDGFISEKAESLEGLPQGAVVGSTSLRRQAQILALRPDIKVVTYRGNVDTRLKKLEAGEVDATLLAVAGLNRLSLQDKITSIVDASVMVPAAAQGVIGIECRASDTDMLVALEPLNHEPSRLAAEAERAMLAVLDGSCRTPIGGYAKFETGETMSLTARVLLPDGSQIFDHAGSRKVQTAEDASALGREVGAALRAKAGEAFFVQLRETL